MSYSTVRSSEPIARKEHTCQTCKETIEPGEKYYRGDGFYIDEDEGFCATTTKHCHGCVYGYPSEDWGVNELVQWAQQFDGVEVVTVGDYGYVGYHKYDHTEHYMEVGGDRFKLSHRMSMRALADWLFSKPQVPDVSADIGIAEVQRG